MSATPSSDLEVVNICERALGMAPEAYPPTLPSAPELLGAPAWYGFEHAAWALGEDVRQAFSRTPRLKSDPAVVSKVVEVATCRNLRRGRQSFITALGFVAASGHASRLAQFLGDPDVDGQVVSTLLKMKAAGFSGQVRSLTNSKQTWIRRLAQRYLERYPPDAV